MAERIQLQAQIYGFEHRFASCPLSLGELDSFEDAIALLETMVSLDENLRYQCHAVIYPSDDSLNSPIQFKSLITMGERGYMVCEVTDEHKPRVLVTASTSYSEAISMVPAGSGETFYLYASLVVTGLPLQGFLKAIDAEVFGRETPNGKTTPVLHSLIESIDKGLNIAIERLEFAHMKFKVNSSDYNSSKKKPGRKSLSTSLTNHLRELDINHRN